jgi:hypothetical protein
MWLDRMGAACFKSGALAIGIYHIGKQQLTADIQLKGKHRAEQDRGVFGRVLLGVFQSR